MNRFAAKTQQEKDREKYLRNRDAILKRNAEYRGLTPEAREEFNAMRRVKDSLKDHKPRNRAYWAANKDAINARRKLRRDLKKAGMA